MTEQQIKELCKLVIEHGQRDFTDEEKEMLKAAVDQSRNWQELFTVAMAYNGSLVKTTGEKIIVNRIT